MTLEKTLLAALAPICPASLPPATVMQKINDSGACAERAELANTTAAVARLVKQGWCAIDVEYDGAERWRATPEGKVRWVMDGRPAIG